MGGDEFAGPAARQHHTPVSGLPDFSAEMGEFMGEVCVVGQGERRGCPQVVTVRLGSGLEDASSGLAWGLAGLRTRGKGHHNIAKSWIARSGTDRMHYP